MKKLSSLIIALFVLGLGTAFGQSSDDATISANAEVLSSISVVDQTNLDFTEILPGVNASIEFDTNGDVTNNGTSGTPTVGEFLISGAANASVELTLSGDLNTLSDGTNTLTATFGASNYVFIDNADSGGGNQDLTSAHAVTFDGTGSDILVQLGGLLEPTNDQAQGTYTGNLTLTANQTSF